VTVPRPLKVSTLAASHRDQVATWLGEPQFHVPLDVRPTVTAEQLADRLVPGYDDDGTPIIAHVGMAQVNDAAGSLVGFGITYGWDHPNDDIRELDAAFPRLGGAHATAALEALTRLIHYMFAADALEVRIRTRTGNSGQGFSRVFARLGANEVLRPETLCPKRRTLERRVLYVMTPDAFYGSKLAKRYGCQRNP